MLRPPAPWDAWQPSIRRRRPWVDPARCFCSSSENCGVDTARTVGHRTELHPGQGARKNSLPYDCLIKTTLLKKKGLTCHVLPCGEVLSHANLHSQAWGHERWSMRGIRSLLHSPVFVTGMLILHQQCQAETCKLMTLKPALSMER